MSPHTVRKVTGSDSQSRRSRSDPPLEPTAASERAWRPWEAGETARGQSLPRVDESVATGKQNFLFTLLHRDRRSE